MLFSWYQEFFILKTRTGMNKWELLREVSETEKQSLIILSRGRLLQCWKALNYFPRTAYSTKDGEVKQV